MVLFQRSLETVLSTFQSFYFILLFRSYFHHFIFQLTDLSFYFDILLLVISRVFLISVIVLFVSVCLLFNSSRCLLIDSCIFFTFGWQVFWSFFHHHSESFSGSLPISSSFIWTTVFLVSSFILVVFLCLFIIYIFNLTVFEVSFSQTSRLNSFFLLVSAFLSLVQRFV